MNSPQTTPVAPSRFSVAKAVYLRSVILLATTTVALLAIGWLNAVAVARLSAAADSAQATLEARQQLAELTALENRYGAPLIAATIASVPDAFDLPTVYEWLEAEAADHDVTVQYNFTSLQEEEQERLPNQWTLAVDFLGSAPNLQALLSRLETGLYHLAITSFTFDSTDPSASQLKLMLVLYGGSDG